jgi:hypothetical protein
MEYKRVYIETRRVIDDIDSCVKGMIVVSVAPHNQPDFSGHL